MPFTPSHAVLALPFIRTPLVPAAIAVGAMTPDLPLFIRRVGPRYGETHDLAWLHVTVLMALVLLLLWRCVLRPAVRELMPDRLASRIPVGWDASPADGFAETFSRRGRTHPSFGGIVLLLVSLAIGVVSHIVWDTFTHEGRLGVTLFPALAEMWGPLAGYKWLQYASGIIGLGVIALWALLRVTRATPQTPVRRSLPSWVRIAWWISLPATLVIAWVVGLLVHGPLDAEFTVAHLAYLVLPPACAIWAVLTFALCVVLQRMPGGSRSGRR